ncbi:MAG: cob(I)yrinic acid a,c-diamide adenosyltransferase, partial [Gammaproteobacteria bacterium]|nr:cob(I)yrinic acid a,c-diamide adenosyltransferase [Gammaproteobacteria bacterium]
SGGDFSSEHLVNLENIIELYHSTLTPLREFILPGGVRAASLAHVCRTICRRAERSLVALGETTPIPDSMRMYLNRLSDLLFIFARVINRSQNVSDVYWKNHRTKA